MNRRPTVADIARELNISKATAAAALSGRGGNTRVGPEMIARVQEAARRMNYRTNAGAQAISRRRFNTIGFFVAKKRADDFSGSNQIPLSIVDAAEKLGQTVLLVCIPTPISETPVIPRSLKENCLDGLIIQNTMALSPEFHQAIESSQVPVVYMNEKAPTNSVYVDDVETGRVMTRHLIERGFSRIAVLAPATRFPHYSAADRVQGYLETITRAGLEPIVWNLPTELWRDQVRAALQSPKRPDAIFCTDDGRALLLQRILYDLRLRVPEDIAIAGCDDEVLAMHSAVPLTTLHIPFEAMARASVQLLMNLIQSPGSLPSVIFQPELVVRASTQRATSGQ